MWLKIILIVITGLFILTLIVKRFTYFRPSYEFMTPRDNYQNVYEGNLHAWYKKGSTGKVILFCHGNAGNLTNRQDKLIEFSKMGHSVLIFDYSGFGHSRGIPNEQLCYNNACMFINFLTRNKYDINNIIPYGESMGAAVAAYVARRYNLSKLIIESGLPSIKNLIKSWYGILGTVLGIVFYEFNTISYLQGYRGQSLIMHSVHDEIIPYSTTNDLQELATKFVSIQGNHNKPVIPWGDVSAFISS